MEDAFQRFDESTGRLNDLFVFWERHVGSIGCIVNDMQGLELADETCNERGLFFATFVPFVYFSEVTRVNIAC